jgi:hypothetical protein
LYERGSLREHLVKGDYRMKRMIVFTCGMAALCFSGMAYAISGGAAIVDRLTVDATSFDQVGTYAVMLESEVAAIVPTEDWSVIVGVDYRSVNADWTDSTFDGLGGELGIKYYFTRMSSLAALGTYENYDYDGSKKVAAATLRFDQRFMPARSGVSPFFNGALGVRFPDYQLPSPPQDRNRDYILSLGIGCDFMITDTLAMTIGAGYKSILGTLTDIKDITKNDGWIGTVGFVGYWD